MTYEKIFNEFTAKLTVEERKEIEDYRPISGCGMSDMSGGIGVWFNDGSKVIYFPKKAVAAYSERPQTLKTLKDIYPTVESGRK